jgi:hypothetical protein
VRADEPDTVSTRNNVVWSVDADEGAAVAALARRADRLADLGSDILPVAADVTTPALSPRPSNGSLPSWARPTWS